MHRFLDTSLWNFHVYFLEKALPEDFDMQSSLRTSILGGQSTISAMKPGSLCLFTGKSQNMFLAHREEQDLEGDLPPALYMCTGLSDLEEKSHLYLSDLQPAKHFQTH